MKIHLTHFFLGKLTFFYALGKGKTEHKLVTLVYMLPINVTLTYMLSTNIILILHASN